ncbi:MAG: methyltransferase domain-containing protein [Verrucomicrobiae bacterium]
MSAPPNATAQTEDFEFAALDEAKNYREALLREFSSHLRGQVLEVGAGIGQIAAMLLQNPTITKLVSIEPDTQFCAKFRAALPTQPIIEGTIDDLADGENWNAILSVNVLEHIEADERELAIYRQILAPAKGALCLFVPARQEIYAPIDRDFGHFRRYTRPELHQKLERAGFEIMRLRYYNFIGYFAWWLSFCVLKKRGFDLPSVRFFDRVLFPPMHSWETKICAPPFGQSLLAVARAK